MYDPCGNGPSVTMNSGSLSLGFNCMLEAQVTVWNEVTGSGSAGVWTVKVVDMLGGGRFFFSSVLVVMVMEWDVIAPFFFNVANLD